MKYSFLLFLLLATTIPVFSQKMDHDRYTVSGGLLGAMNFSKFTIGGDNAGKINYDFKPGWSAGAWLNLPLGKCVSLEPQVMYSDYNYQTSDAPTLLQSGHLSFISVPVLFKFHLSDYFALTLGPQMDFLGNLRDTPEDVTEDDFESTSFSASAGFEIFPHAPLVIFGRYIQGLNNMDARGIETDAKYYNSDIQVGLKLKLFGKVIPADTDGDGVQDTKDKCPTVFGLASMEGCPDTDSDGITDASDMCPKVAGLPKYNGCPIPDTDNDGVNDEVDKCPKVAGVLKYEGCPIPDTDGDGINDDNDKCPAIAGISKYNGCPVPDTDGDGINDDNDKCPTVKGVAQFNGCPNPDKDNDGVLDADDLCPTIKGPKENDGCPIVENAVFSAKKIQFVTGKAELTAQAKKDIKEGAKLLNSGDFAHLKIEIRGHTDNVGSSESNHTLSHKRADAVKAELIKDGVSADRLTTIGFGEDKPIADNGTAAGRTLNRRVELKARE